MSSCTYRGRTKSCDDVGERVESVVQNTCCNSTSERVRPVTALPFSHSRNPPREGEGYSAREQMKSLQ